MVWRNIQRQLTENQKVRRDPLQRERSRGGMLVKRLGQSREVNYHGLFIMFGFIAFFSLFKIYYFFFILTNGYVLSLQFYDQSRESAFSTGKKKTTTKNKGHFLLFMTMKSMVNFHYMKTEEKRSQWHAVYICFHLYFGRLSFLCLAWGL